ncbi:ATP synthase F1 subunit epsilon [bacterium]|nr:ATP synthase F1 subunit epsilon [bacterium]
MFVEIVSPSGRIFSGEVTGVRAPGVEGSFEVLRNHAPMIAAISIGSLVITDNSGNPITFATSGGFVEVSNNTVTILAETAELGSKIDVERAQAAEARAVEALAEATDPETKAKMTKALERARNRARVSMGQVGRKR